MGVMTYRELLELAAKAAGMKWTQIEMSLMTDYVWVTSDGVELAVWNPLTDDGDALRLAVKLGLVLKNRDDLADAYSAEYVEKTLPSDPYAATRRAIVRAAAEIGKDMK